MSKYIIYIKQFNKVSKETLYNANLSLTSPDLIKFDPLNSIFETSANRSETFSIPITLDNHNIIFSPKKTKIIIIIKPINNLIVLLAYFTSLNDFIIKSTINNIRKIINDMENDAFARINVIIKE